MVQKLTFIFFLVSLFLSSNSVQAQESVNTSKNTSMQPDRKQAKPSVNIEDVVPEGFPKFVNTGNPDVDQNNYQQAKDKWYAENPEKAAKLKGDLGNAVQEVSKRKFNSLDNDLKAFILAHPENFKLVD